MFKMWYNVFITVVYINSEHNDTYVINENAYNQRVRLLVIFIFYWYQWHKFNTQYYVNTTYVCM